MSILDYILLGIIAVLLAFIVALSIRDRQDCIDGYIATPLYPEPIRAVVCGEVYDVDEIQERYNDVDRVRGRGL